MGLRTAGRLELYSTELLGLMLVIGVGVGLVAATLLARSMGGVLYGISPFDLPAFSIAALALVAAGLVATLVPAVRTTRIDPMIALREP